MSRIISDRDNFIDEITGLVMDHSRLAFPMPGIMWRLKRRIMTTAILYGVARGTATPSEARPKPRGMYTAIASRVENQRANIAGS